MHSHLLHVVKLKFLLTPFDTLTNTLDSLYQPRIAERAREGLADGQQPPVLTMQGRVHCHRLEEFHSFRKTGQNYHSQNSEIIML